MERARNEESDELEELEQTSSGSTCWRRPTRCSAPAECGSAFCTPRSTRCRCGRSSRRRSRCAKDSGESPQLEVMVPLVAYEQELELMRGLVDRVVAEEDGDG